MNEQLIKWFRESWGASYIDFSFDAIGTFDRGIEQDFGQALAHVIEQYEANRES